MRVIIVGGGLGGLLLAHRLLQEPDIEVVVLERDENPTSRDQGIVIGLSQDGVDAINSVGLGHILEDLMNAENGARNLALRSQAGAVLVKGKNFMQVKLANGKFASQLLPRGHLRTQLGQALAAGIIRWNSRVVNVHENDFCVTAELSDGQTVQGDVLVGADGARSFIRSQFFPELVPISLGLYTAWGTVQASKFPDNSLLRECRQSLVRTNGRMGCSMLSFVFAPRDNRDEHTVLFWAISLPNAVAQPIMTSSDISEEQMRARLCEICRESFDESSQIELLVKSSEKVAPGYELTSVHPSIYKTHGVNKNAKSRVTLLGDAAHKTTTQAGLGATAAFQDALALGKILAEAQKAQCGLDPEVHLRQLYEPGMQQRARRVVGASYGNTQMIHQVRGPVGMAFTNGFMWTAGCILSAVQGVKAAVSG